MDPNKTTPNSHKIKYALIGDEPLSNVVVEKIDDKEVYDHVTNTVESIKEYKCKVTIKKQSLSMKKKADNCSNIKNADIQRDETDKQENNKSDHISNKEEITSINNVKCLINDEHLSKASFLNTILNDVENTKNKKDDSNSGVSYLLPQTSTEVLLKPIILDKETKEQVDKHITSMRNDPANNFTKNNDEIEEDKVVKSRNPFANYKNNFQAPSLFGKLMETKPDLNQKTSATNIFNHSNNPFLQCKSKNIVEENKADTMIKDENSNTFLRSSFTKTNPFALVNSTNPFAKLKESFPSTNSTNPFLQLNQQKEQSNVNPFGGLNQKLNMISTTNANDVSRNVENNRNEAAEEAADEDEDGNGENPEEEIKISEGKSLISSEYISKIEENTNNVILKKELMKILVYDNQNNKTSIGEGKINFETTKNKTSLVVFRNKVGTILFQGKLINLSKVSIKESKNESYSMSILGIYDLGENKIKNILYRVESKEEAERMKEVIDKIIPTN